MLDFETIVLIIISCMVSSVVSVMLTEFRNGRRFEIREIVDFVFPAFVLTIFVLGFIIGIWIIFNLIFNI